MILTAGEIHDATRALSNAIARPLQIPQTTKYRLARLHAALLKEYEPLEAERVRLVQELGSEIFADPETKQISQGWSVPVGTKAFADYTVRWNDMRTVEHEIPVLPIKLSTLGDNPFAIEANEFLALGKLIEDDGAAEVKAPLKAV